MRGSEMPATDRRLLNFARTMRNEPTEAERRLWNCLRNRTLDGYKFSRQVPIGNYIADFVCREKKLIVEIDGETHDDAKYDERRTRFLEEQGYRVHRANNDDVYKNLDGVLQSILIALEHSPSPAAPRHPLPRGERGK
jgi:very-short-patch-repair endonuclease